MITSVTGVILAGGKSSRMGTNKALLPYQGQTILQHVIRTVQEIFSRVVLSVNSEDAFPHINLPRVVDRYPETGPIGGITSVFESGEKKIFCVACDMPRLNRTLIEYLCRIEDCDAVIPIWHGKIEVLHALYSDSALPLLQSALKNSRLRIVDALLQAHVRYFNEEEIRPLDPLGLSFRNLNNPSDYQALLQE